ncbi:MAG TPA: hypothetical protein VJM33_09085 [Microthrixaceae bacterium]|nr:hypothetical protein [Microthrixaceae bacterium]
MSTSTTHRTRLTLVALIAVAALVAATPAGAGSIRAVTSSDPLTDLSAEVNATDGTRGVAISVVGHGRTKVMFLVWGFDASRAGEVHGAHVHIGPCVAGNGAAAGPHWNAGGGVSHHTEVWLDFTITPWGFGLAKATIPHEIPVDAAGSIVIHASPTAPDGTAGARLACLPMNY